ncbi:MULTISPECIES: SDR family NAD(P)-dependent oxidoreductase [unclassified Amycolatopsis]|uniref:SDR family NAD(P)-dependent oxidoreductase n=1 Tax=unclassified Amycolatopsis TaxID=2618356 RepID=UPI001C6A6C7A|nr:SDR family NAD(P)-dependent oxidoreductase [Amycolatopsis sp. DSM 110486]QYN25444.1 SDR family NAD(P)-dependent oxidoreductase [Amycolatopsis sp. DSM 110486]
MRITTPFTRESTAADVSAGVDLTGRRAIVTGGASGIGVETARALAQAGAEVTLAVRNTEAGHRTAQAITAATGNAAVDVKHLELADRASVAKLASDWQGPLHILVNNAGVMAEPLNRTPEGWEHQFATNHLGHFGLALGLHDALAQTGDARIVAVSSSAHLRSGIVFDDIHFERREYDPWSAYGQSKSANVLFAVEATRRWATDGITANALMPGGIRTNLQRHQADDPEFAEIARTYAWKTTEQGASTSVLLAVSPLLAGVGGRYFEDNNEAEPHVPPSHDGVAAHALDPEVATLLWEVSLELLAR